jgi:spermidine synthase
MPNPARHRALIAAAAGLVLVLILFLLLVLPHQRVLFDATGDFGRVRVVEARDGLRRLYMGEGRAVQTALYPGRPLHLESPYARVAMIGLALAPADGRILFVGLGGGAMPMYARQVLPAARLDAVEIDSLIVDVAVRWFGFQPDAQLVVHVGDGRAFIERAPAANWDVVVLDAFSDDEVPYALTTYEFLAAVRVSLAPGGVVVSNLWTRNRLYGSMVATYQAVFDEVHLLRVPQRAQRILVAGDGTRRLDRAALVQAARALEDRTELGFDLAGLVSAGYEATTASSAAAPVLRDR